MLEDKELSMKDKIVMMLFSFVALLINATIIAFLIELIWRQDMYDTLIWLFQSSNDYWKSVMIVFILEMGIYSIFNNVFFTSLLTNMLFLIISLVNYFKYNMKGEVFTLSDLTLYKEAFSVVDEFSIKISSLLIVSICVIVIVCVIMWFIALATKFKVNKKIRVVSILVGLLICSSVIDVSVFVFGEKTIIYIPEEFYKSHGFISGMVRTLPDNIEEPDAYSQKVISDIYNSVEVTDDVQQDKPNVIFIMNESLFDINALDEVKLSEDPLKNIKEYQEDFTSGNLRSPSYGGNTCQVEYEVLTGYSSYNVSGIAYTDYISDNIESLVSLYKNNGYKTYAMHPNVGTFFNRIRVYKSFGFDHILFLEDFSLDLNYMKAWVDDVSLYKNLIFEFEKRDKDAPFFSYVVTTQNHGGHKWLFEEEKYITLLENDGMNAEEKNALCTYVNLCKYADIALDELLQYFQKIDEPVIIVFFGDHSPYLNQFGIDENERYLDVHKTPLLIWNNYGLPKEELGDISAYRLGAYVATLSGINSDMYVKMLSDSSFPNTIDNFMVNSEGVAIKREEWDEETIAYMEKMWLIQYDRMFGKNYYSKLRSE